MRIYLHGRVVEHERHEFAIPLAIEVAKLLKLDDLSESAVEHRLIVQDGCALFERTPEIVFAVGFRQVRTRKAGKLRQAVQRIEGVVGKRGETPCFCVKGSRDARNAGNVECCAIDRNALNGGDDGIEQRGHAFLHAFEELYGFDVDLAVCIHSVRNGPSENIEQLHASTGVDGHSGLRENAFPNGPLERAERLAHNSASLPKVLIVAIEIEEHGIQLPDLL